MVPSFCPDFPHHGQYVYPGEMPGGPQGHESPLGPSPLEIPWWKLPLRI